MVWHGITTAPNQHTTSTLPITSLTQHNHAQTFAYTTVVKSNITENVFRVLAIMVSHHFLSFSLFSTTHTWFGTPLHFPTITTSSAIYTIYLSYQSKKQLKTFTPHRTHKHHSQNSSTGRATQEHAQACSKRMYIPSIHSVLHRQQQGTHWWFASFNSGKTAFKEKMEMELARWKTGQYHRFNGKAPYITIIISTPFANQKGGQCPWQHHCKQQSFNFL
jgi:hypothetical protein